MIPRLAVLTLCAAIACGCASQPAVSTEPVSGMVESGTTGLGATWSRDAGVLTVVVRPTPGAMGSRVPRQGTVLVGDQLRAFEPGRRPGELVARVPYTGTARALELTLYASDAAGRTVLSFTNRLSDAERAEFEAKLRALERKTREQMGLPND